jgi:uncharacterized protein (DUF2141 family)
MGERKNKKPVKRSRSFLKGVVVLAVMLLSQQCANPVAPSGGPRDTLPPKLVMEESTPNEQVNYYPEKVTLTFNEYIEVSNPVQNVIISPPMDPKPEYVAGSSSLEIDFSSVDSLRPETTYTLNFTNAIADFTEGNRVENLVFAFSTGPYLDSLEGKMTVIDATGAGQAEITVLLHEAGADDSVVVQSLPTYFAKTDKQGVAQFQYLKKGRYKVFAMKDDNLTLKYDIPNAPIAFLAEPVELSPDTFPEAELLLFEAVPAPRLSKAPFFHHNHWSFVFNKPDTHVRVETKTEGYELARLWVEDTLNVWPNINPPDSIIWLTDNGDELRRDTLVVKAPLDTVPVKTRQKKAKFLGGEARLYWNQPMSELSDSIFFTVDTSGMRYYFRVLKEEPLQTVLGAPKDRGLPLSGSFQLLPGVLSTYYGKDNTDTLDLSYEILKEEQLSELTLRFIKGDSIAQYLIHLVKGSEVVRMLVLNGQEDYEWQLPFLEPGQYKVKVIYDDNKNGKQDGGDYWKGQQPELSEEYPLETLRANWVLEEEIELEHETRSEGAN